MDNTTLYRLWTNYKAKKRLITEKKIKGRCELRERHWKLLERFWYARFIEENNLPKVNPALSFFLKHYPGIKDENLRKIVVSQNKSLPTITYIRKNE